MTKYKDERLERIFTAADFIRKRTGGVAPVAGIVCGSGLGKLADKISDAVVIPYAEIPGFPVSTAVGHAGNFVYGDLGGKKVIAMQGRFHYYEGYPMDLVTLAIRVMKVLGIGYLFVSNAAGALNPSYHIGQLIILKDHINLMPNPLIGPNLDDFGPRFPDMTRTYDRELIERAKAFGRELGEELPEGVYLASTGPTYETPSEVIFFHRTGADLVGMSTVPEVIVARHSGIRVFGMSVVTNISNTTFEGVPANDADDVVQQAGSASDKMTASFEKLINTL